MRRFLELLKHWAYAIARWFRDLPLWLKYGLVAVLFAALAGYCVWRWGLRQQIDGGLIAKDTHQANVDNLWFLPDGTLVGTERIDEQERIRAEYAFVSTWHYDRDRLVAARKAFHLRSFLHYIERKQRAETAPSTGDAFAARANLHRDFAITRDGSRMAVLYLGYLVVFSQGWDDGPDIPRKDQIDLGSNENDSPGALALTDNNFIALAYPDGRVEFRYLNDVGQVVGSAQTKLGRPTIMKPIGGFLAVVSPEKPAVVMLDVNALNRETQLHGYPPSPREGFRLAISGKGRLVLATGSSEVRMTQADGSGDANIPLQAYGTVKILSFYDEDRVLTGGDFQDVYLLSQGELPYNLAIAPSGVNALAVNSNRIAYAGKDGVFLAWHTKRRLLSTLGKIVVGVLGALLIGLLVFYRYDLRSRQASLPLPTVEVPEVKEPLLPLPNPPEALIKACSAGDCVLYAGAGLSAQAGFPPWPSFVEGLTDWVVKNDFIETGFAVSLKAALEQGQYDSVADNIVSAMRGREDRLNAYLRAVFLKSASLPNSYGLLRDISSSAILTTNFDTLLEVNFKGRAAPVYTPKDSEQLLQCLTKREFFLLKLYGTLERPETVMISPAQYDDAIKGNLPFSKFMETLFFSRTLFFIGSSLEGIEAYLKGIAFTRQNLQNHYALVAVAGEAWQARAKPLKERYGIEVLPYSPSEGFPEVQKFLQRLSDEVRTETERTKDDAGPTAVLKKIILSDIGPFERLEIDFDSRWNILLGDNGVGKSTILKAIAIAILGEDARSYAGRIVKSGKTNGLITLITGRNTYTTKLFRKNGEARVESIPGRPFEAEGWLAVGFPPLRTVSWARPKAAETETKGRPTPEDLLPVITGDTDPRLDKLKQWIVNIDYWIKDARSRQEDPSRYERLLNEFFKVVTQLTKGVKVEFKEVKAQTNEVTIITDDGELPIESLSQGMTSLIGWVGILLQRLYEVYGDDEDPKQRYALVLMDEIDAHLHPAWQQSLIRELGKIFPNVQFIATTHSPLIVGGMRPEQILRFARDEDQQVVVYKVEEEMTMGRADQILTGDLFGLQTTFSLNDELQAVMNEYHELLAKNVRSPQEEIKFQKLRESLKTRIPLTGENPPERRAMELLKALLKEQTDGESESVSQGLLDRAENLLDEVVKRKQ